KPGEFVHTLGDAHIYANHFDQAREQLTRTPKKLPQMWINPDVKDLFAFRFEDFRLEGYEADPTIKAPIAVGGASCPQRSPSFRSLSLPLKTGLSGAIMICRGGFRPISSASRR